MCFRAWEETNRFRGWFVLLCFCVLFLSGAPASAARLSDFLARLTPAEIFPGADHIGAPEGDPPLAPAHAGGRLLGHVYLNTDVADATAYSGKPIHMLIAIDVGNTNSVIALYDGGKPRAQWRTSTSSTRTADEYAAWLSQIMAMEGVKLSDINDCIISNVVPQSLFHFRNLSRRYFNCEPFVVTVSSSSPAPRWRDSERTSVMIERRTSGSPPVRRSLRTPRSTKALHSRSSSSSVITSCFGRNAMFSDMQ